MVDETSLDTRAAADEHGNPGRREFLKAAGKVGVVAPPALTMLLSTSLTSKAIAGSGGNGHGKGRGRRGRKNNGKGPKKK